MKQCVVMVDQIACHAPASNGLLLYLYKGINTVGCTVMIYYLHKHLVPLQQ